MSDSGNGLRCPGCGARLGAGGCVLECHRNPSPTKRVTVRPGDAVEVVASDGRVRELEAEVEQLRAEAKALSQLLGLVMAKARVGIDDTIRRPLSVVPDSAYEALKLIEGIVTRLDDGDATGGSDG